MPAYADFAMNIRNLNLGTERVDSYRSNNVADAARNTPVKGTQNANEFNSAIQDKVEISDAARAALARQSGQVETDFARKALSGVPPLSEKRAADIMERVQSGFYSRPDVLRQTAEKLANELTGTAETE